MPVTLAQRIQQVQPSATLAVDALAKKMKAEGQDVVGFGAGEPDFHTPEHIVKAGVAAMTGGDTYYSAKRGAELLTRICDKFKRENGLEYKPSQVLVSNGAKHTLYNLIQVLVDPGDEVLIPAPYWVSYLEMARLAGGVPVVLETNEETGFKLTPAQLEAAITPKSKVLFFNSPSNPTGAMYTPDEMRALAAVIEKHNLITLSDEIYEHLCYEDFPHVSLASLSPKLHQELVVTVNGVSKSFSMTGWRIGYCAGPEAIVKACANLQSHATSAPAAFSQAGAAEAYAALEASAQAVKTFRAAFKERRDHIVARLNALPGVTCQTPAGAFYVFPNVSGLFGRSLGGVKLASSMDFVKAALEQAKVAVVPGEAFGSPRHIRMSYASDRASLDKGLDRLADLLKT